MLSPSHEPSDQTAQVQALFVRHAASLRAYVVSLLPEFGLADDILQEMFLTVTAKAGEFELGTNFLAWAKCIARYKVFAARRAHWRECPGLSEEALEALCESEPDSDADRRPLEERLSALAACIGELPPTTRRAVELRYKQAHPTLEVARLLGSSPGTLYVMLSRARVLLRECVDRKVNPALA